MRSALRCSAVLLVFALATGTAAAGSVTGVDAMSSSIMQHNQTSFSGLGARLRLTPVPTVGGFEVLPGIEYWRSSTTVEVYDIKSQRRDATLAIDGRYRFAGGSARPYVGAGFAIHFLSDEVHAPSLGVPDASHSIMKGGLAVLGGVSLPLAGAFESFLEAKYHAVTDNEQLKLSWGLTYNIK